MQYMQQSISDMIKIYQGTLRVVPQIWRGLFAWTFHNRTAYQQVRVEPDAMKTFLDIHFPLMKWNPNGASFCNWHANLKPQHYRYFSPESVSVNQMKPESITLLSPKWNVNSHPLLPIKLNLVTKNFVTEEKLKAWRLCYKN